MVEWYVCIYQSCFWSPFGLQFVARDRTHSFASALAFFRDNVLASAPALLLRIFFIESKLNLDLWAFDFLLVLWLFPTFSWTRFRYAFRTYGLYVVRSEWVEGPYM